MSDKPEPPKPAAPATPKPRAEEPPAAVETPPAPTETEARIEPADIERFGVPPAPSETEGQEKAAEMPPSSDVAAAGYQFPKMHPEGTKFVVAAGLLALFFWFVIDWDIAGWLTAGLAVWIFAFFRDPVRVTPQGDGILVSPADGLISHIMTVPAPRQLAGEGMLDAPRYTRISVFMSVFDVHINRSPVDGVVKRIAYVPGTFVNAELDKASEDNERQYFLIERPGGEMIGVTQIAGLVARRIMKFVGEGQAVSAGERIGLIRFGSRVDVFLPAGYTPQVILGQRAVAGETILAAKGGAALTGKAA
ncbi:MAG: phosphatidylserine decarboxylase [Pacificimonas sp.]|jgi:phosphatidylserine decarboxylase|nr:phosphatidylserine decarboxylase [Pacificimonas sp.]